MQDMSNLYFECHITVEPLFDADLIDFKNTVERFQFRAADLLMQKRQEDTPERSKYDTFATGRGKSYADLVSRMVKCVEALTEAGFKVWRYKIEDTLIDSRHDDVLGIVQT